MTGHILLVEDDSRTRRALAYQLQYAGYRVTQAPDGITALECLEQDTFEVVLSDMMLGDIDGIEVLHTARRQPYLPAVILLTGHATIDTSLAALREGAVDYLQKPCPPERLLESVANAIQRHKDEHNIRTAAALIREVYHRSTDEAAPRPEPVETPAEKDEPPPHTRVLQVGALLLGSTRHDVRLQDKPLQLTPIEFELLRYLAETPGQIRMFRDIVRHTHDLDTDDTEAQMLVKQHIRNLRKKLGGAYLVNRRGIGYMLIDPDKADIV